MVNGGLTAHSETENGVVEVLKILGRVTSINVRKVLWALDELGTPYEREDWGLPLRDPHDPAYLRLNPNALVPTLIDGDFVLWESHAILRYLAEKDGRNTILPSDLPERAHVEQWLQWQSTEFNPSWRYAVYALLRKDDGFDDPVEIAKSLKQWGRRMQILEDHIARSGDYAGKAFSIADIALGLGVHRWYAIPAELPEFPALRAYHDRLKARPAAAQYMTAALF
jgi:glutathione S-transferase